MKLVGRAPESLLTVVALTLLLLGFRSTGPIGAAAALLGATLCICVLPGYFVAGFLAYGTPPDWPDRWVAAVGFSLVIIECACVAGLMLHIALGFVAFTIASALIPLAIFRMWRPTRNEIALDTVDRNLKVVASAAWVLCALIAYAIGNHAQTDPNENLFNIGISDALRTASGPEQAFYVYGVDPVYPFPGLNYAYALVSRLSGLSTIFSFEKMRFLWTFTALATIFVGVRTLSGARSYAYSALLVAAVLALAGPFGPVPGLYWGQLATTSLPSDVAMNVISPIALCSLFKLLSSSERDHRSPLLLFGCMALTLAAVHQLELVQLVVYAGCALVVLRGRKPSIWLGCTVVVAACGALAYRTWAIREAPGIADVLSTSRVQIRDELHNLNIGAALRPLASYLASYNFSFLYCLNGLMLLATGLVLVQRRYSPAIRACSLAVAAFCFTVSFAILTIPVLWGTYDELFRTPVRHIIFVLYCCSTIAFVGVIGAITARGLRPAATFVLAVAAASVLAGAAQILQFVPAEITVIAAGVCGLLSLIHGNRSKAQPRGEPLTLPLLAALCTFALLSITGSGLLSTVFIGPLAFTPRDALQLEFDNFIRFRSGAREGSCQATTTTVLGRQIESESCFPPFAVVAWLHDNLPPSGVLLVNSLDGFFAPGLIPVRVAVPPGFQYYRDWEAAFPRARQVIACSIDRFGGMPFFSPSETPKQRYQDARALSSTLVLADPSTHDLAVAAAHARPDLFGVLLDQSGWVLLAVKPARSINDMPSCLMP